MLLCLVATASRPEWPATSEVNRAEQPLPGTTAFDSLRSSSLRRPRKGLEELMPKDQFSERLLHSQGGDSYRRWPFEVNQDFSFRGRGLGFQSPDVAPL